MRKAKGRAGYFYIIKRRNDIYPGASFTLKCFVLPGTVAPTYNSRPAWALQ
jgi:hypothetical protein